MAFTCKSAGLVVMLMLAALVASAQAADTRSVLIQNKLPTDIKCNNVLLKPGEQRLITLDMILKLLVLGKDGKWVSGQCDVPKDVATLAVFLKVDGIVAVKVVAVLGGLIHELLKTVVGTILLLVKVIV